MSAIKERLQHIQDRITAAATRAGRDSADITLVGVSKTWPVAELLAAYEAGLRHFGENRPEELADKRPAIEAELGPDNGITWHHIGIVQSRKTSLVATYADYFHALDRLKIANRLATQRPADTPLPTLIEINISGESSKSGFACHEWETNSSQRETLVAASRTIQTMPALELRGLMTMAPWDVPEAEIRALFRRTRELAAWLNETIPGLGLSDLSMGMSGDFETCHRRRGNPGASWQRHLWRPSLMLYSILLSNRLRITSVNDLRCWY